jgi:hypothetical protein
MSTAEPLPADFDKNSNSKSYNEPVVKQTVEL